MEFPTEFTTEKLIASIGATEQNVTPNYYFSGISFTSTDIINAAGNTLTKEQILDAVVEGFKVIAEKLAETSNAPQAFLRTEAVSIKFEGTALELVNITTEEETE